MALISVVTATYNRANVLRLAIESLLAQTVTDWELIVVGDACTDDTADVVASFGDPRMRFANLPENSGDQAAPNNEGVRLASGELVAFLNHDDLWTRDHLAVTLAKLRESQADLVFTITISIDAEDVPQLEGVAPSGVHDGRTLAPASSWLMRRALFDSVGPWRRAREVFGAPSQDWLFRAWRKGHRLVAVPKATVIALQSGSRQGSYTKGSAEEHERYAALLRDDPELIARLLTDVVIRLRGDLARPSYTAARTVMAFAARAAIAAGVQPHALTFALKYRRRGGFIDALRRTRGLSPLPRKKST